MTTTARSRAGFRGLALTLALLLAGCTVTRTVVDGTMAPTIPSGSTVGIEVAFGNRAARFPRWTVVLHEDAEGHSYVRRVVGLPNERVQWDPTGYRINGRPLVAPPHVPSSFDDPIPSLAMGSDVLLGSEEFFLAGDFGSDSADSRLLGPIPLDRILGRVTTVNGRPLP
jgi:signal peptidase I